MPLLDDVGIGIGGFALDGEAASDQAGYSLAGIGDVNGDGLDDLIVGAHSNDAAGYLAGAVYVLFGDANFGTGPFDLANVGVTLDGISFLGEAANDNAGLSIAGGGDYNGDGVADFIIGASGHDGGSANSGRTYVIFGAAGLSGADVGLYNIEYGYGVGGAYGVVIDGEIAGDNSGYAVADAGDVNGDGFDDILLGAPAADPNGSVSGRSYVVYGQAWLGFGGSIDLDDVGNGIGGFAIDGQAAGDYSGFALDGAGDVTGDGYADLLIGAPLADPNGASSGRVYVIRGGDDLGPGPIALADVTAGVGGVAYQGEAASDYAGMGVGRAGDFNNDGRADFIIGAYGKDVTTADRGRAYLVFGSRFWLNSPIQLSTIVTGTAGIPFSGLTTSDQTALAVGPAGDVNLDGLDDILISAHLRNPHGSTDAGTAFLAFGGDDPDLWSATTLLSGIHNWIGGFTMEGESGGDRASFALRGIGDVNGDGVPDIGVGAPLADPNGSSSGRAYVVFGDADRGNYYTAFNRNPVPGDDIFYTTPPSQQLIVPAPGVLENDVDHDDDPMTVVPDSFITSAGSAVVILGDGSIDFESPHPGWWGEEIFDYRVQDGQGGQAWGAVRIRGVPAAVPLDLVASGEGGFALDGIGQYDGTAQAVANAGDVDGDGLAETLIGAHETDPQGLVSAGATYLYWGTSSSITSPAALSLGASDAVGEAAFDWSGIAVSAAGDFNGDGLGDFVVGAIGHDPVGPGMGATPKSRAGRTYVVFGDEAGPTGLLAGLDGSNGFALNGEAVEDDSGRNVAAAGDVNGDGLDDIIVGAYRADVAGQDEGRAYVIYGTDATIATGSLELADVGGSVSGFVVEGEADGDFAGFAVGGDVDVNGDAFDDVLIGAYFADPSGGSSGRAYVVYGDDALPVVIPLSDVANPMAAPDLGVAMDGEFPGDLAGRTVAGLGDVDGDGFGDLIVGAPGAAPAGSQSGRAYVLFGGAALQPGGSTIALGDVGGTVEGFVLDGEASQDGAASAVARLGDLNADGYADFIIGAPLATGGAFGSGRAYVIVGRPDFNTTPLVPLADIATGIGGFAIDGELSFDSAGHAVGGGGDVNGDGFPDIIVGAYNGGPNQAGRAYVIFGGPYVPPQGVAP